MLTFEDYKQVLCRILYKYANVLMDECDIYTIKGFSILKSWNAIGSFWSDSVACVCQPAWFPVIYYVVLLTSFFGVVRSFLEFFNSYCYCDQLSFWRQRSYYVLPYGLLRRVRVLTALVAMFLWLALFFGIIMLKLKLMFPWLWIYKKLLTMEVCVWFVEVLVGATRLNLRQIMTFALALLHLAFTACVYSAFERELERKMSKGLAFFGRGEKNWMNLYSYLKNF